MKYAPTNTVDINRTNFWIDGYSAAGCVTSIAYRGAEYSDTKALGWNAQYQLTSVSSACSAVNYSYDVLGRRISRTEGMNVEHYKPQTPNLKPSLRSKTTSTQFMHSLIEVEPLSSRTSMMPGGAFWM